MDLDDIKQIGAGIMVLILAVALVGQFFVVAINVNSDSGTFNEDVTLYPDGEGSLYAGQNISNFSANQTLGTAIRFRGDSSSYLSGEADIEHDETWSVSTWTELNASANASTAEMRVLRLGEFAYIDYNQTEWRAYYYNEDTLNSYEISVAAPDPTNATQLSLQSNATHLTLTRNNNVSSTVELTDGNAIQGEMDAGPYWGWVEETRVYDDVLNSTQRQQLIDDPVHPLQANETARIYYDVRSGESSVDVYRTGQDLSMNNVGVIDGFAGDPLTEGVDYTRSGGSITALDGGELDGAPVVFVTYYGETGALGPFSLQGLIGIGQSAFVIAALAILVYGASLVLREVDRF